MVELNLDELLEQANNLVDSLNGVEEQKRADDIAKEKLVNSINKLKEQCAEDNEALDIATHAIEILTGVSDSAVQQAYNFLQENLNKALERMFENTTRKIRLKEKVLRGQYPQLEIELTVSNGNVRSLKTDSGHGLAQIVSLLCILSLIAITGKRRILVMDEIISGLSVRNREIVSEILWQFTNIGFQFIVNEHGFVPKGSKVYHLEMKGDISSVKETYIENKGVYLNGLGDGKQYSKKFNNYVIEETGEFETEDIEKANLETGKNDENVHRQISQTDNILNI